MSDEINREENVNVNNNDLKYVNSSTFVQDPNKRPNTDIKQELEIYYTSLEDSGRENMQLFLEPDGAREKAERYINRFPNHIVKFFMFYYEPVDQGEDGKIVSYRRRLCQVVPGLNDADEKGKRSVNRKALKSIYNKIDFISIYRPTNKIKWYTVSKEEMEEELAVIRTFYGLSNFPNKVGDYYFSKKVGKWLQTYELADIIQTYGKDEEIPVFYPDETEEEVIRVEHKTLFQIFWDWLYGTGKEIGKALNEVANAVANAIKAYSVAGIEDLKDMFKDDDGDGFTNFFENLMTLDTYTQQVIEQRVDTYKAKQEQKVEEFKNRNKVSDESFIGQALNGYLDMINKLDNLYGSIDDIADSGWARFKNWITSIFGSKDKSGLKDWIDDMKNKLGIKNKNNDSQGQDEI